jgi:hypothetical protein
MGAVSGRIWGERVITRPRLYLPGARFTFRSPSRLSSPAAWDFSASEICRTLTSVSFDSFIRSGINIDKLELIAKTLLEFETLDGQQVAEIVRTGKFTPPAPTPRVEPTHGGPAGTPLPEAPGKPPQAELPGLGTPVPAPV